MGIEEKKEMVREIRERIDRSKSVYFTNFKNLKAAEMSELRSSLKQVDSEMKVYKNRMIKRALQEIELEELTEFIEGPMALVFGYEDPIPSIKIIADFQSENEVPVVNGGYLDGEILDGEKVISLSKIPSREELLTRSVEVLSSPLNKMVHILSGIPMKLMNILSEISKQKEE